MNGVPEKGDSVDRRPCSCGNDGHMFGPVEAVIDVNS